MDHRSRQRGGIGLSRVSGTQIRAPRVPLPFHVEQEAREGEEWERELPRHRPVIYGPSESEELQDNIMSKYSFLSARCGQGWGHWAGGGGKGGLSRDASANRTQNLLDMCFETELCCIPTPAPHWILQHTHLTHQTGCSPSNSCYKRRDILLSRLDDYL